MNRLRALFTAAIPALSPVPGLAHSGGELSPQTLPFAWTLSGWVLLPLAVFGLLYARGMLRIVRRQRQRGGRLRWRAILFALGYAFLVVALISPLDALGDELFAAHMAQHLVLMLVAAPLLILSRPLAPLLRSMPRQFRRDLLVGYRRRPMLRTAMQGAAALVPATVLQLLVLWVWHAPVLFRAAFASDLVHAVMHASFLWLAMLFWWAVVRSVAKGGGQPLIAALCLLLTLKLSAFLGLLFSIASRPVYPEVYSETQRWGLSPLEDQQLAAVMMWVSGMPIYPVAALAIIGLWLARLDAASRRATHEIGLGAVTR